MRATRALFLSLAASAAGCGTDPTLAIIVHNGSGTVSEETTISVYVSPSLTCADIRFSDLDDATLASLEVAELTLLDGAPIAGSLDNLPRTDHKVIAARAIRLDGRSFVFVAGGCVEVDAITDNTTIEIDTEPAVLVALSAGSDAYGVGVTVTGLDGAAIAGREVSWRVIGPDGTMAASLSNVTSASGAVWEPVSSTCTSSDGTAVVHPVPPDLSGGYAARIRVAWAQQSPAPITALTKLSPGERALTPVATMAHPCTLGYGPSRGVVACANANGAIDEFTVHATGGVVSYATIASATVATPAGIYAVPANGSDLDVIAVDAGSTPALPGTGKLVLVSGTSVVSPCPECNAFVDVMYVPACGTAKAQLLGRTKDNTIRSMAPLGGPATRFGAPAAPLTQDIAFVSAGCVTRFDPTGMASQVQLVVFDYVTKLGNRVVTTSATIDCAGPICASTDLKVPGAGVGFTGGLSPSLVVSSVDATGVVVSTVDIVSAGSGNVFLELSRIASAGIPHRIATGQFDDDGQLDYFWDNTSKVEPSLQIAYAKNGFAGNLSALTGLGPANAGGTILDVRAGHVHDDAHDDAVIVTSSGVVVMPSLVPAETGTVPADPSLSCPAP